MNKAHAEVVEEIEKVDGLLNTNRAKEAETGAYLGTST